MEYIQMISKAMTQAADETYVYPEVTQALCDEIVSRLLSVGQPLKILLFGSRARGDYKPDSDLDLLIVESDLGTSEKMRSQYSDALRKVYPDYNLFLCSIDQIEEWQDVPNHLYTEALSEGKLLYEETHTGAEYTGSSSIGFRVAEAPKRRNQADLARLWFEKADKELSLCQKLVDEKGHSEYVCFHAQQASEKYLKGFLALHKVKFKKTHDLGDLSRLSDKFLPESLFTQLRLGLLSEFYWKSRYSMDFSPTSDTAEDALAQATAIREIILAHVPEPAKPRSNSPP